MQKNNYCVIFARLFFFKQFLMNTYRQLVYFVLDQLKLTHDDSYIEEDHVLFVLSKIRAFLLKSKYSAIKNSISQSNFQTITVTLEPVSVDVYTDCSNFRMMKSVEKVPNLLLINSVEGETSAMAAYGFPGRFTFVNNVRFLHVGWSRYLKDFIYVTIGTDGYLYIKSSLPTIYDLQQIQLSSVFENIEEASMLDENETSCELLDRRFPIEEGLAIPLMELAAQKIYTAVTTPSDETNNASDEMSNIHMYLRQIVRKDKQRGYDGEGV